MAKAQPAKTTTRSTTNVDGGTPKRTRGGHLPTGTSADRRARAQQRTTARGERTRTELLRAARTVFEEMGYMDARVSDIVREANIAHGSFYTYFESKLEIFQEVLKEMGLAIRTAIAHHPDDVAGETIENLKRANRRYLEVHQAHAKLMVLYEQVATFDTTIGEFRTDARMRHVDQLTETIMRLQDRGLADPTLDPRPTAGALVAMLSSYAHWSTVEQFGADLDTVTTTINQIWSRALKLPE